MFGLNFMQLLLNFSESNAVFSDLLFFTVATTGDTNVSFSTSCIFSKTPDWISLFASFSTKLYKWSGMGLIFCFIGGRAGLNCILFLVSVFVRLVLSKFPKLVLILLFSDWSVFVIVTSIFRIIEFNSRSQSITIIGFMSSRSVKSVVKVFLILLFSASTVTFRRISLRSNQRPDVFLLYLKFFCLSFFLHPVIFLWPLIVIHNEFFFCFLTFNCHGIMISSISYVFYLSYYVYRLVGIVFFGLVEFRKFFDFLLSLVIGAANFRKKPFSAVMTYWFSGWAFIFKVPISCITICAISLFWSLFQSFSLNSCVHCLCTSSSLISSSRFDISASGIVLFLFLLSYAFWCTCSSTFSTSNSFSFNRLSRSFLLVIDVINFDTFKTRW